jgi:hypothetical protein
MRFLFDTNIWAQIFAFTSGVDVCREFWRDFTVEAERSSAFGYAVKKSQSRKRATGQVSARVWCR